VIRTVRAGAGPEQLDVGRVEMAHTIGRTPRISTLPALGTCDVAAPATNSRQGGALHGAEVTTRQSCP